MKAEQFEGFKEPLVITIEKGGDKAYITRVNVGGKF
jgi:hypothetical protein